MDTTPSTSEFNPTTLYCLPGADDSYLRPDIGGAFAPRRIAMQTPKPGTMLASWIHYTQGGDHLVVTSAKIGRASCRERV